MNTFVSTTGVQIQFDGDLDQLRTEHILQTDRMAWVIVPTWPFLAIDRKRVRSGARELKRFPVFSCGQLWQNMRGSDLGARLIGSLVGGGTNAGLGRGSRAFVNGKANAKANVLLNWNPPLIVGTTPWSAAGSHCIYVDDENLFQYKLGELITVGNFSRPSWNEFDFTALSDLRDRYNQEYLNVPRDGSADLVALAQLLDDTFAQNALSLAAAETHHFRTSPTLVSADYEAPVLTKYERLTHDVAGAPKIEVSFALLHYEKAIIEFNALKAAQAANRLDDAFAHGVYCTVAVAACLEAIANHLVQVQTSCHPTYFDKRVPLKKINDAASAIATDDKAPYEPLGAGQHEYDLLDRVRQLRNQFMHAKEIENDIDPIGGTVALLYEVNEAACRSYLAALKSAMDKVFSQLQKIGAPIVTKANVTWLGDLEVP